MEGSAFLFADFEDGDGGFEALEAVVAVAEPAQGGELVQFALVRGGPGEVKGGFGEEDLVGTGEVHDAEGEADAEAGEVFGAVGAAGFLDFIVVDADAVADAEVGGLTGEPGTEFVLESKGEAEGLAGMGKGEEDGIAAGIDDLAAADALEDAGGELVMIEDAPVAFQISEGGEEAGGSDDVGEDQGLPSSHGGARRVRLVGQGGRVHRQCKRLRCMDEDGKHGARRQNRLGGWAVDFRE